MFQRKQKDRRSTGVALILSAAFSLQFLLPILQLGIVSAAQSFPDSPTLAELAATPGCYNLLQKKIHSNEQNNSSKTVVIQQKPHQNVQAAHCLLCLNLQNANHNALLKSTDESQPGFPETRVRPVQSFSYPGLALAGLVAARAPPSC